MKTLHINTSTLGGGAESVVRYLCATMPSFGYHANALSGYSAEGEDKFLQPASSSGLSSWCRWRGLQYYDIKSSHLLYQHPRVLEADILHLHNLHGDYFNYWSLPALTFHKPTVWTLHDMQALTGHCAYSLKCERWTTDIACGKCPAVGSYPPLFRDTTKKLWADKSLIFSHSLFTLVTPSKWLQRLVEKSLLKEHPLYCIPNAVDTGIFRLRDKAAARRSLGLPENALVVGGCAHGGTENPWKGGQYVIDTVKKLQAQFPELIFLNIGVKIPPAQLQQDWIRHIPYVTSSEELAILYSALDILLYPTLADNHPLVCIESLCCGTPVVGFATGGVPEIVRHGQDGLLVPTHDGVGLLREAVTLLRNRELRKRMSHDAAADAAARFNLGLFAERYAKVYEDVMHISVKNRKNLRMKNVPFIIKSPDFMRLEYSALHKDDVKGRLRLLGYSLMVCPMQQIFSFLCWPLKAIRSIRSRYLAKVVGKS